MQSLLLVAHGSRREASNEEVRQLAERLRQLAGENFSRVEAAFLELADPSIPDGIEQCIASGANSVTVLPYFLSAGRHVSEDIPAEVAAKQQQHPDVAITLAPYLGSAEGIVGLILNMVSDPALK